MQAGEGVTADPETWDEVYKAAAKFAYDQIKKDLAPVYHQVQKLQKTNLERLLDDNCHGWREYEDEMMANLKLHPTLVNNPEQLYQLSVPPEVLESKAMQQALKKLQTKAAASKTSGVSTTTKKPEAGLPDKPMSFDEAVKFAQVKIAEEGLKPP